MLGIKLDFRGSEHRCGWTAKDRKWKLRRLFPRSSRHTGKGPKLRVTEHCELLMLYHRFLQTLAVLRC